MNDIKRIIFKNENEEHIEIHAVICESPLRTTRIGQIFSKGSYSGKHSIQVCGFDSIEGPWLCGCFNNSQDICMKWIDEERWVELKDKSKYKLSRVKNDAVYTEGVENE